MEHLACFAGGMIAYGAQNSSTPKEDLQVRLTEYVGRLNLNRQEKQRPF